MNVSTLTDAEVLAALRWSRWNVRRAAEMVGVSTEVVRRRIRGSSALRRAQQEHWEREKLVIERVLADLAWLRAVE